MQAKAGDNDSHFDFKTVLKILAQHNLKKRLFVNMPYTLLHLGLKLLEKLPLPINLRSDSLVSLMNCNDNVDFKNTHKARIVFRKFSLAALQK